MESARCKAFVAAAECGSFTAAAGKLGYTPSGVSQLVTALEKELGFPLLDRSRRGVTLTGEGERFLPEIRGFLGKEDHIYELAAEVRGLTVGSVAIASYPSVATYIELRLMEGIRQEMLEWIDQGIADMGFLTYTEPMDYEWIPLAEDRMVAVLPVDHPLAGCESYPLSRCEKEDFIMPALGHDVDVEALLTENRIRPHIKFTTLENPATLAMIQNGLGMSIMNELHYRLEQKTGQAPAGAGEKPDLRHRCSVGPACVAGVQAVPGIRGSYADTAGAKGIGVCFHRKQKKIRRFCRITKANPPASARALRNPEFQRSRLVQDPVR